jgi:hypothetical protein
MAMSTITAPRTRSIEAMRDADTGAGLTTGLGATVVVLMRFLRTDWTYSGIKRQAAVIVESNTIGGKKNR